MSQRQRINYSRTQTVISTDDELDSTNAMHDYTCGDNSGTFHRSVNDENEAVEEISNLRE